MGIHLPPGESDSANNQKVGLKLTSFVWASLLKETRVLCGDSKWLLSLRPVVIVRGFFPDISCVNPV